LIWNGNRDQKIIYLTFDDGPVPGVTDRILEVLHHFNVKATFFCVGQNIDKNPELFRRIHQAGHMIGNHTYHHLDGWSRNQDDYLLDIRRCTEVIGENGYTSKINLFRPPYGKIRKKIIHEIINEYHIVMWDVLSYDFSTRLTKEKMLQKSIHHTEEGSIVIFHDSEKTKNRAQFLIYQYIDHFISNSYKFSTIDELILSN
jgi:peptidoglycan/xylan/chitin deacetylase (PgdA/CDA1 family)